MIEHATEYEIGMAADAHADVTVRQRQHEAADRRRDQHVASRLPYIVVSLMDVIVTIVEMYDAVITGKFAYDVVVAWTGAAG